MGVALALELEEEAVLLVVEEEVGRDVDESVVEDVTDEDVELTLDEDVPEAVVEVERDVVAEVELDEVMEDDPEAVVDVDSDVAVEEDAFDEEVVAVLDVVGREVEAVVLLDTLLLPPPPATLTLTVLELLLLDVLPDAVLELEEDEIAESEDRVDVEAMLLVVEREVDDELLAGALNWYTFKRLGPPQNSVEFPNACQHMFSRSPRVKRNQPLQSMAHSPIGAGTDPAEKSLPQ